MSDDAGQWRMAEYEGFEVHVSAHVHTPEPPPGHGKPAPSTRTVTTGNRYTYAGYVCHPGADPKLPGHAVPFHADGEESFGSEAAAWKEGMHVGRTIVDGTHPDLTVLPLVTGGV
ncbi:hypothetical protein WKR88_05695 [Trinickia caryophylli]|uniref:Uncharacterized protein n=1 Tax=Trinickia caryophylli TaxID=28094 RepID=A0A1X7GVC7_TRICW|nr:hypothetical protein [Trinickia caryophylli]PMS09420.1 hypothetical protein C0Z17_25395 [Trinickia caryophylli]TRX18128.1 hypothetical protein FNF07_07780 [Trinickia caryophylli]WQE11088.1 hypothetical protein U0034_15130 [Trinickia caryophylli]SMF74537.1 hypothetical protein SAMN06295900_11846 [Trinickia caryophylli]GLU35244.1 hypothetical protein Busp01_50860 [Trinickia caryophylli]